MPAPLIAAETSRRITVLRSLLMLCVVCIHAEKGVLFHAGSEAPLAHAVLNVLCRHVFQAAVPLYFAISGYLLFLRYDGNLAAYPGLALKRFKTIMLPCILANLFWVGFILVEGGIPGIGGTTFVKTRGIASLTLGVDGLPLIYPLWFLRDLFIYFLLSPVFALFLRRAPYMGLAALWLCWNFMLQEGIPLEFSGAFFFYLGGLLAVKRADVDAASRWAWPLAAAWAALMAVSACIQISEVQTIWRYPAWRAAILVGAPAAWALSCRAGLGGDGRVSRWLFRLTPYIFFIYLTHEPALSFLADATGWMLSPASPLSQLGYTAFLAASATAATLAAAWLLRRFAQPVYGLLTGGR
jgi:peptidoglycan/LPS O-acetylase OafA/YrhL